MNSFKRQNKFWSLLSFGSLLPLISFTSCETNKNTPEPKLQKKVIPFQRLEEGISTKKSKPKVEETPKPVEIQKPVEILKPKEIPKPVEIPDKSLEWAKKSFPEILDEKKTFPPNRELSDQEFEIYWDKSIEYLIELHESIKKMKAEKTGPWKRTKKSA